MFRKIKNIAKKIFKISLILLILALIWYYELVWYGVQQGIGQAKILWNAKPTNEFLESPTFVDSLKQKIRLVAEIKQFSVDSLGINPSKSYEKMYDQKGKPILWIVTASAPFELKAHQWEFGFLGKFSYKGHFDRKKAEKDSASLAQTGLDADVEQVSAWSTLGWFNDPILSSMLVRKEGDLANLIIHELTHGTLYVKDDVDYNENLASFVGDYGAIRFLTQKFGQNSPQLAYYMNDKVDDDIFNNYMLSGAKKLDTLFKNKDFLTKNLKEKQELKIALIKEIIIGLTEISFKTKKFKKEKLLKFVPNNTFFMGYVRYYSKQNEFEKEFKEKFDSNFPRYFKYLKEKYPSL